MPRPREARIDDAVLRATLEAFFRAGVDGLSMVEVAAAAGVGRQSIYRRWPTKRALVLAAVEAAVVVLPEPRGTTVRERLGELLGAVDQRDVGARVVAVAGRIAVETERHPEIARRCVERFVLPRRRLLADELRAGVERGELRADLDVELVVETLTGALLLAHLTPGADLDRPPVEPSALVDLVLGGAAQRGRPQG